MSYPFIAQITMFGGSFAPRGWAFCNGQLLPISSHTALFSVIGTTYGGDGITTFGLPDLRGRSPMHAGNGAGLTPRNLGQMGGAERVTLTTNQLPAHNHNLDLKTSGSGATAMVGLAANPAVTNTAQTGSAGGGQPHNNLPPYQCVSFIIALEGTYPSRS